MILFGKMIFLLHFKLIKFNECIKGQRHKAHLPLQHNVRKLKNISYNEHKARDL